MHALHPVHLSRVTCIVPPSLTWLAPVGHALTHGAFEQWLHRSERISARRSGNTPRVSSTIQSRQYPSGTSFSALQARTHAWHPTQSRVSTAMAYRVALMPSPSRCARS